MPALGAAEYQTLWISWRIAMNSVTVSYLTQQLPYQVPLLLASLVGIILSILFWRRCPGAAALTLIATVVLLVNTVVVLGVQTYIFSARVTQGWTGEAYTRASYIVSLVGGVVRGFAVTGLVIAVFVGRKRPSVGS